MLTDGSGSMMSKTYTLPPGPWIPGLGEGQGQEGSPAVDANGPGSGSDPGAQYMPQAEDKTPS